SLYYDSTAINVYLVAYRNYGADAFTSSTVPKLVTFRQHYLSPTMYIFGEKQNLAHEVGHVLGLRDNYGLWPLSFPYSSIDSLSGSCCNASSLKADDLYKEVKDDTANHKFCNSTLPHPNNVMGDNWLCRRYFSPLQLAI